MGAVVAAWSSSWGEAWGNSWGGVNPDPAPPDQPEQFSGGYLAATRRRQKDEIRRDRDRFGITEEGMAVVEAVAARQSETPPGDEQKRMEELLRELELRGIEWNARYMDALTVERRLLSEKKRRLLLIAATLLDD